MTCAASPADARAVSLIIEERETAATSLPSDGVISDGRSSVGAVPDSRRAPSPDRSFQQGSPNGSLEGSPRRSFLDRGFSTLTVGGIRHSTLTLTSTALGGGVLSVAYVMCLSGVALGSVLLSIGAIIAYLSTVALMEMTRETGCRSYAALFAHSAGPVAGPILDMMLVVYGNGSCVGYMVFLSDFIPAILREVPSIPAWVADRRLAILASTAVLWPLVLQKDVAALRHVTPISIIALAYTAIVVACFTAHWYSISSKQDAVTFFNVDVGFFEAFSICVFAFNCHINVVPVASKLERPSKSRITKVSYRVNALQLMFYMLIGITGYLSFLSETTGDILAGYASNNPYFLVSRALLTCSMLVAIAINLNPTVQSALQFVDYFRQSPQEGAESPAEEIQESRSKKILRMSLATVFLLCQAGIACVVPQVSDVLSLLGGTVATAMMMLIPAYAIGKTMAPTLKTRMMQVVFYIFAVISGASVPVKILQMCHILQSRVK